MAAPVFFAIEKRPITLDKIVHPKGMDYSFDRNHKCEWLWQEMIAQLDDASIDFVVCGPEHRSRGIVACSFETRPNSYDHKRMHALKNKPAVAFVREDGTTTKMVIAKLPVWDFVVFREDGTGVRLHPQWSTTAVESFDVEGHSEPVETPQKGLGCSDGPGTYKHYKTLGSKTTPLKFNATKRPHAVLVRKSGGPVSEATMHSCASSVSDSSWGDHKVD